MTPCIKVNKKLSLPKPQTIDSMFVSKEKEQTVQIAAIRLATFIAEHNLSFNIMDHLRDLLPKIFPDSPKAL